MLKLVTTAHPWCDGHSTSISTYGVWRARTEIQVSRRKLHSHIHLDQARVELYLVFFFFLNVETRQKLYLSGITKLKFSNLISHISLSICVGFLFSQPQTYIRIILRVVTGMQLDAKLLYMHIVTRDSLPQFIIFSLEAIATLR